MKSPFLLANRCSPRSAGTAKPWVTCSRWRVMSNCARRIDDPKHAIHASGHDLSKSPGSFRTGPIFVQDDLKDEVVYAGPEASEVPSLVEQLVKSPGLTDDDQSVAGAMAHLNLVMIHPFRDGNGRLARALQTLVLARRGVAEPEFASIEEWLGANTPDYYRVLAHTGAGAWHPERDAEPSQLPRAHGLGAVRGCARVSDPSQHLRKESRSRGPNGQQGPQGFRPVRLADRRRRAKITDPYPWLPERLAQQVPHVPRAQSPAP